MKTLILILLCSTMAHADWFCTEESSQVMSNEIDVCGVAAHKTEGEARAIALEFAQNEFTIICNNRANCRDIWQKFDMVPARTECKPYKGGYKCYRMVRFVLNK